MSKNNMDLLRMRKGLYVPYWYPMDKLTAAAKANLDTAVNAAMGRIAA